VPWFPVLIEERDAARAALGIDLPTEYERQLLSPAIATLLRHPTLGVLTAEQRMMDFVALTAHARRTYTGFPADGVVATTPQGRYFRFWRPDPRHPDRLGEMRFSWDTVRQRASKDCTNAACIALHLEILAAAAPDAFAAVDMPLPTPAPEASLVRVHPRAVAREAIRGDGQDASAWFECGALQVTGRSLTICDVAELPDRAAHASVAVTPGDYAVTVQWSPGVTSGERRLRALRLLLRGATPVSVESRLQVDVDTGAVAVWDRQPFFRQVAPDARDAVITELGASASAPRVATVGRSAGVVVAPAGAGDGRYPVTLLCAGNDIVGITIRFTAP
jgi:hypothetical protein